MSIMHQSLKMKSMSVIGMSLALFVLASCQKPKKSGFGENDGETTVETLDNLASENLSKNKCLPFGDNINRRLIVKEENITLKGVHPISQDVLRSEVYTVMSNIPQNVLTVFFAIGGKIEVNKDTNNICQELAASGSEGDRAQYSEDKSGKIVSCWSRSEKGAPTIYVDPATESIGDKEYSLGIHHSLIRSFGYVLSELVLSLDIKIRENDFQTWDVTELENPTVTDQKMLDDLAAAFISDVDASNGKYDLKSYKNLIDGSLGDQQKFRYFVFAEAFDSYHCSEATRSKISRDFPETSKIMAAVVQSLSKLKNDTDTNVEINRSSAVTDSFGLVRSSAYAYENGCNCFQTSVGGVLSGILDGIRKILLTAADVIETIIVGVATAIGAVIEIVVLPFTLVFGAIQCNYVVLSDSIRVGSLPVRGVDYYYTPLQHPCQSPGQQSCNVGTSQSKEGGVGTEEKKAATAKVTSETVKNSGTKKKTEADKAANSTASSKKKKKKKKWYQCGSLGDAGDAGKTGMVMSGVLALMLLPVIFLMFRRPRRSTDEV